ncbi:MAG: hypothetical protein EZS28_043993 [Streblomastix strix]|uniref:SPRY domain-containing protein n=1 Tax=Streblomastix strix TaxID=222440 RepID=A0A5J4TR91_9EUKA|nr:MAG: hypothetical protein EZS28_043993 [Streblomastix strix]
MLETLTEMIFFGNVVQFLGVCQKTLKLKNHDRFLKIIETLKVLFVMKNPDPETVIFEQVDGILSKVKQNKDGERVIELDPVITDGIYLFEIIYEKIRDNYCQGPGIMKASYAVQKDCNPRRIYTVGNSQYSNGQKIGLELDKEKGTLHFFIDGVQQPVFVRGINEPVRFYGHIYDNESSFTIVTFKKLPATTTHTVPNEKAVDW